MIINANIRYVDEVKPWMFFICTECRNKVLPEKGFFTCFKCKRRISHPEKRLGKIPRICFCNHCFFTWNTYETNLYEKLHRYQINIVASDNAGPMEIQLQDREVRILIGKRADGLFKEVILHQTKFVYYNCET